MLKKCSKCMSDKDINDFHFRAKGPTLRAAWCKSCVKVYQSTRTAAHPTHVARRKFNTSSKKQILYVLSNPAWVGWVKIGAATRRRMHWDSMKSRLNQYNICSPLKDYVLEGCIHTQDAGRAERIALTLAAELFERGVGKSEWFKCSALDGVNIIKQAASMTLGLF